jgi:hypothetical protein
MVQTTYYEYTDFPIITSASLRGVVSKRVITASQRKAEDSVLK